MKLPDHTRYPHGIVLLTHWTPDPEDSCRASGVQRHSTPEGWRSHRDFGDVITELPEGDYWTWAGFDFNKFNTSYFLHETSSENNPLDQELEDVIDRLEGWFHGVSSGDERPACR